MKKSLLLLSAAFTLFAATLSATSYSNASWNGAWMVTGLTQNYVIFDGAGNITAAGIPSATGAGTYNIAAGGAVTGTLNVGGTLCPFTGALSSDSVANVSVTYMSMSIPATFIAVKNTAVMQGTYDGTIVQTAGGSATLPINFTVDAMGNITSSTNLTGSISGALYYSNGKVTGLIKSGEAAPFTEIEINITSGYSGSNSLSGAATLTGSGKSGTFALTKSATVSVNTALAVQFNAYPNPAKDLFVVEGAVSNGNIKVYDVLGNVLMNTTITSSKTILNVSTLSKGVYFYNVTSGTAVSAGKFIVE